MKGSSYLQNKTPFNSSADSFKERPTAVKKTLQPVPKEDSNLEAEKGEVVVMSDNTGLPTSFTVAGKRHYDGGTHLSLPPNSFIFSRDNAMKIKDPAILKMFNMGSKTSGYSPAEIAKKYDINTFRKVLADKNSDKIQRDSAESMIRNYNEKLAQLALSQEAKKGFPTGIPAIAMPYMSTSGLDPAQLFQQQSADEDDQEQPAGEQAQFGGNIVPEFYRPNNFEGKMAMGGENDNRRSSNRGEVVVDPTYKQTGGETLRRVRVTAPKMQSGGGFMDAALGVWNGYNQLENRFEQGFRNTLKDVQNNKKAVFPLTPKIAGYLGDQLFGDAPVRRTGYGVHHDTEMRDTPASPPQQSKPSIKVAVVPPPPPKYTEEHLDSLLNEYSIEELKKIAKGK